ncbi:hypothetical protein DFH27DRAFT_58288 [Peziza echinospora]|nr:hypothetical protein DFH27DRAFT_58288 [Peziza echinospora]
MDARTGAMLNIHQKVQLPPIMHSTQLESRARDRPLPLEPYGSREIYTPQGNLQQQHQHQQPQFAIASPLAPGGQHPALSATQSLNIPLQDKSYEQLRRSLVNDALRTTYQPAQTPHYLLPLNVGPQLGTNLQDIRQTHVPQPQDNRGGAGAMMHSSQQTTGINLPLNLSVPNTGAPSPASSGRLYPPILPWTEDVEETNGESITIPQLHSSPPQDTKVLNKGQKVRRKWTDDETKYLFEGCFRYGVGNWKKMLDDPEFKFDNRSSVDLKDRYRTVYPKSCQKIALKGEKAGSAEASSPRAKVSNIHGLVACSGDSELEVKTESPVKAKGRARRKSSESPGLDIAERLGCPKEYPKAPRRERKPFAAYEDMALLKGFERHGALWSKIQGDKDLNLSHRRSTDLRDRFRNAFPERYTQAGFKARPKNPPKPPRSGPANATQSDRATQEPTDNGERSSPIPSTDTRQQQQYDPPSDAHGLEEFDMGPTGQIEDHSDDSRKDEFNVSMMQEFLATSSARDWNNDSLNETPPSLFSANSDGRHSPPAVTTSMSVESALTEDFSASTLAQFEQQGLFQSPVGGGKQDAQDMVRWEDMVTHPIFTLETPSQGMGGLTMEADGSVTLAPINPVLLGGSGNSGISGHPAENGGGGSGGGNPAGQSLCVAASTDMPLTSVVPGLAELLIGASGNGNGKRKRGGRFEDILQQMTAVGGGGGGSGGGGSHHGSDDGCGDDEDDHAGMLGLRDLTLPSPRKRRSTERKL